MSHAGDSLFSIGHSNQSIDLFLALLKRAAIEVVADVRSVPYSRYASQFDYETLKNALEQAGIRHVYLGDQLGGRPEGDAFYDDDGRVRYDKVAESASFREGLRRLRDGMSKYRVVMMCSEEDPAVCHRYLLVARVLEGEGVRVQHIRADGRAQSAVEIVQEAARDTNDEGQLLLFEAEEVPPWRSIQSVSRKSVRQSSSGH